MDEGYTRLLKISRDIRDSLSTTLKINHEQVEELVVADLLGKYKGAIKRNKDDKWVEPFKTILLFYLEEDELEYLLSLEE